MTPTELAALHATCFTHPRPWSAQEFSDLLESDAVFLCTTQHGFLLGRIAGQEVELLTLAVDPSQRRKGLAQTLMQQFETHAKAHNVSDAFLEVSESNTAAIALYQRHGFTEAGKRKDYYASPTGKRITALVMTKPL